MGAWPWWKWLRLLNVILIGVGSTALLAVVLWHEWQIRRGRRRHDRGRSILGVALVELSAVATLVHAIAGFDAPPRFTGFLGFAVGLTGVLLIVGAWQRPSSSR